VKIRSDGKKPNARSSIASLTAVLFVLSACNASRPASEQDRSGGVVAPASSASYAAIALASDRSDADRALDDGRKPAALLAFAAVAPGMRVAELGVGTGYTTELLARAVGDTGLVYAQNSRFILERFAAAPWAERLAKPVMANVVRLDREFDDPFPGGVRDLDAVINVLFYHDTVWMGVDRDAMNRAVFAVLKPGGRYVIVDHSAAAGAGVTQTETLHRIEESVVRTEIERSGFLFERSAEFLRNPADPRDWNAAPRAAADRRGTSDRFVLSFVKP
jgi:predicted methyltransferase